MNFQAEIKSSPQPLMSERRVAILGAMLVAIGPISLALFTPAMPELVHAFGTTEAAVKLTISCYFGGFAITQLICGPLSDGFGRKPVTAIFLALYLAGSIFALFAPTIEILIAARVLQGCGAAVGVATSRAIVRDLFTKERSARIMNLVALILSVAPAVAPTLGGVTMELFGWEAIFILMVIAGLAILVVVQVGMTETVVRDTSRIKPKSIARSYRTLLGDGYFVFSSLVLTGGAGAMYTQATLLPFILIDRVGLTPTQFGVGMLTQSLSFVAGSLVMRRLMGRFGAYRLVPVGLTVMAIGGLMLAVLLRLYEPSYLLVMVPAACYAFGISFTMPAMSTASVAAYPHMAGSAAAMSGFLQMGGGLVGGLVSAAIGDPVLAQSTIIPLMGVMAIVSWLIWRTYPEPALAKVVLTRAEG